MHFLLIRFSSMGDVVLQTATINWLKSLFGPQLRISFVTSSEFVSLLETHPGVDEVVGFNRRSHNSWPELVRRIQQLHQNHPIDLILDLHATLRSFRLRSRFFTIPALTVDKRRWERWLMTRIPSVRVKRLFAHRIFGMENQVQRIIEDFKDLLGDTQGVRRVRAYRQGPHEELTSLGPLLTYTGAAPLLGPYAVMAPSASFAPKRWPIKNFVELAQKLLEQTSMKLVILAGPEDDFCHAFHPLEGERLINLQGKTSLKESMSILSGAQFCVGNDSGMNHIAEAHGVPCLTIFGPTDPLFGFAPHGQASAYLSRELKCKPCSTTGSKPCHQQQHFCMEMISVEEVVVTLKKMGLVA
jgi:heptosyltransferase II